MGLYNEIFGSQDAADRGSILLQLLGFTSYAAVGRYRDSWVETTEGGGDPIIAVYTRNGAGNRHCGCENPAVDHAVNPCTALIATEILPAHPLYLRDADDDFDGTYATFYFRSPPEHVEKLREAAQDPVDTSARWLAAIDALSGDPAGTAAKKAQEAKERADGRA